MPDAERVTMAGKMGFVSVEGHQFSLANMILLALQSPTGSVFGGFRQWLKHGRAVRKGEHGAMIWVPIGKLADTTEATPATEAEESDRTRFIIGTVFDISQTEEVETADKELEVA